MPVKSDGSCTQSTVLLELELSRRIMGHHPSSLFVKKKGVKDKYFNYSTFALVIMEQAIRLI